MDTMVAADSRDQANEQPILATGLPAPEEMKDLDTLPDKPPHFEPTSGGVPGGFVRAVRGIPACVWVVNTSNEQITVVVSKYAPNRQLSSGGINASTTGGGLNLNTTTFLSPATKKTLAPFSEAIGADPAKFPLWRHSNGFGVITIFRGAEETLYIENDRLPAGVTAYFNNKPNLRMIGFDGKEFN